MHETHPSPAASNEFPPPPPIYAIVFPDHSWTINTATGTYGLLGYESTTFVYVADRSVAIPLNSYAVVAIFLVALVLGMFAIGCPIRRKPREQS